MTTTNPKDRSAKKISWIQRRGESVVKQPRTILRSLRIRRRTSSVMLQRRKIENTGIINDLKVVLPDKYKPDSDIVL